MGRTISIVLAAATLASWRSAAAGEQLRVEVRETAGIQRLSYPVETSFRLANGPTAATHCRLRNGEQILAAQFNLLEAARPDKPALWSVDFNIDLMPNETRALTLEYGDEIQPTPAPRGLAVERKGRLIRVRHPTLEFVVPDNLQGLLAAVHIAEDDWLMGGSRGLVLRFNDGHEVPLVASAESGQNRLRVLKSGPLAVALEFAGIENLADGKQVRSRVRLDFPLGKSWLRVDWTLDDPANLVAGLSAELRLRLDQTAQQPILADFGANGWTYAALKPDEQIVYWAGNAGGTRTNFPTPAWQVERVLAGRATVYGAPRADGKEVPPQGWAHLMDERRSAAIAVDRFAQHARFDRAIGGGTDLFAARVASDESSTPGGKKHFAFWCHFVKFPPQWGAATSPQSMQTPPEARVATVAVAE